MTEPVRLDAAAGPDAALLAPFDEQAALDVAAGRRRLFAVRTTPDGTDVGSAVLGQGALDLAVHRELRARGFGAAAAELLLEEVGSGPLTAWSHEDHPAARALAARFGFELVRTLLHLRLSALDGFETRPAAAPQPSGSVARLEGFRPGRDDAEWLALNARVFAWHPEQGGTTADDLAERMREPWFRAEDFLVTRDDAGAMTGYCWLKIDPAAPDDGEIYVIGVAPEASGQGLGRALMHAGLARLAERGCTSASLYVEGDNAPAVRLYRSLGFVDAAVHVQYRRG